MTEATTTLTRAGTQATSSGARSGRLVHAAGRHSDEKSSIYSVRILVTYPSESGIERYGQMKLEMG